MRHMLCLFIDLLRLELFSFGQCMLSSWSLQQSYPGITCGQLLLCPSDKTFKNMHLKIITVTLAWGLKAEFHKILEL